MSHSRNIVTTTLIIFLLLAIFPVVTTAQANELSSDVLEDNLAASTVGITNDIYSQINTDAKYCEIIGSRLTTQADWLEIFVERLNLVKERLEEKVNNRSSNIHMGLLEKMRNILNELGELLPKVIKLRDDVSHLSQSACSLPAIELRSEFATLYDQKEDIREEMKTLMSSIREIYGAKMEIGMQ